MFSKPILFMFCLFFLKPFKDKLQSTKMWPTLPPKKCMYKNKINNKNKTPLNIGVKVSKIKL